MQTLKRIALIGLLSLPIFAAPAYVQANACTSGTAGASLACPYDVDVTSGNLLVIIIRYADTSNVTLSSVTNATGTACTTWTAALARAWDGSVNSTAVYYCIASSSGPLSPQFTTASGTTGFKQSTVAEYSGVATVSPFDVGVRAFGVSTACASGSTATLSTTGELAIGVCMTWGTTSTWATAITEYTLRPDAGYNKTAVWDSVRSTTAATSIAYTITSDNWTALVVTFKPSGTAPPARRRAVVVN